MKWSLQICRIFGIPVRVHVTFLLLLLGVVFLGKYQLNLSRAEQWYSVGVICSVFVCVLIHEMSHSLMAMRFGVKVEGITLLPIGGVAQMRSIPREPWQEVMVALTGPVTSLVLAAFFLILHTVVLKRPFSFEMSGRTVLQNKMTLNLFTANLMLGVFNLIPAFPLDGGRVLRGLLAHFLGRRRGTLSAAGIGQFLAIVMFIVGVFLHWGLAVIAMFVYIGAEGEREEVKLLVDLSRASVGDAMLSEPRTFTATTTIGEAIDAYRHCAQDDFPVTDGDRVVGMVTGDILKQARNKAPDTKVADLVEGEALTVELDASLESVYEQMQEQDASAAAVLDAGRLTGLIDLDQINKYDDLRPKTAEG